MFADHRNHYGLGWQIDRKWNRVRQMHGGATPGFQSSFQRYPEAGVTVVALSNSEWGAAEKLATDLAGLCLGEQPYPAEVSVPAEVLDRYVGAYRLDETTVLMTREDGRLVMHFGAQPPSVLYAAGDNAFFQKIADATMSFTPDAVQPYISWACAAPDAVSVATAAAISNLFIVPSRAGQGLGAENRQRTRSATPFRDQCSGATDAEIGDRRSVPMYASEQRRRDRTWLHFRVVLMVQPGDLK